MKKAVVFVVFVMVVVGSLAAQSANDAQKIVGTWISQDGKITFVFNANGTGSAEQGAEKLTLFYGISTVVDMIYIQFYKGNNFQSSTSYKLYFSPDGRRIFIDGEMYQKK